MTTAKNQVFIGLYITRKLLFSQGIKPLVGESIGEIFPGGGGGLKVLASGGGLTSSTQQEKPYKDVLILKQGIEAPAAHLCCV